MTDSAPTAANIIASLGIKGATTDGNLPGYVPVLDSDGRISANLIPANAAQLAIPALSDAAFVDPFTDVDSSLRKGSVEAPFKSLTEAVENFVPTDDALSAGYAAFVLAPGKYDDYRVDFKSSSSVSPMRSNPPSKVFIIGLGRCVFGATTLAIQGLRNTDGTRNTVVLQNILMDQGTLSIGNLSDITLLGDSKVNVLGASSGSSLRLSSDARVSSTDVESISYLSEDARTGNTSAVRGTTVRDALSRLGGRGIRVLNIDDGSSGLEIRSSSSFEDILASSSGSDDIFDLRDHERIFVKSINDLIASGKNIVAETVTAGSVTAGIIDVDELRMDALVLGGYKIAIDGYGYLVVVDGSENPPQPPECTVLLRDSVSGVVYVLGVVSGRLYIANAEEDSSSESSTEILDVITVFDDSTGYTYSVSAESGRLIITRTGD